MTLAQTERELGAHVHGAAMLQVVLEGNALLINLESPAANLVGFEHAPETSEEKTQIEEVRARLEHVANLFAIPGGAACSAVSAVVDWVSVGEDEHGHEEHDDHGHDEHAGRAEGEGAGHAEFHASYTLDCANPEDIAAIDVLLFEEFPGLETLSLQAVLPSGQTAATLTADGNRLSITN